MESLASTTLYLAIAACAVATIAYWVHTLGLGLVVRRLATPIGEGPAVASLGVAPRESTWQVGVDVLCFGGTKMGQMLGEAIIFFNPCFRKA